MGAILAAIFAVGILSSVASAYAMPFMRWKMFPNGPGKGPMFATQQSSVRVDGITNERDTTNVTGTIQAQSRTVIINGSARQGAAAAALWTTNTSRPIGALRNKENFTYTFYTARLVNASTASLNVTGYSFFLNGTWNVYKVETTFTINTDSAGNIVGFNNNQNAVALATNAYGEFTVPGGGRNFTLAITGVKPLTGFVHFQRITTKMFNPFRIGSDTSTTVTPSDVASVASAYGSMPGYGNYDQNMDYNFNYRIDICDLATAAANLNQ